MYDNLSVPPLVSVVMPVRNGIDFIRIALDSILSQTVQDLEVIVVDDGSDDFDYTDLSTIDSRIRIVRLEGNGVSAARNAGMKISRGQFIAFLDADDYWFPGKLAAQVCYFSGHPEVGCVFGGFIKWLPLLDGSFPSATSLSHDCSGCIQCDESRSGWIYTRLLTGLLVGMNTGVIRREVYEKLGGFEESMRIGEDYIFWLKVSRVYEMHSLDDTVALYRIHTGSAMKKLDAINHQGRLLELAVARWGLQSPDGTAISESAFKQRVAESHFTHGYNHFWRGESKVALRSFWRAALGGMLPIRSILYIILIPFRPLFTQ